LLNIQGSGYIFAGCLAIMLLLPAGRIALVGAQANRP